MHKLNHHDDLHFRHKVSKSENKTMPYNIAKNFNEVEPQIIQVDVNLPN